MKKTQVFFWVEEVRRGREDLSNEEMLGTSPNAGLDEILAYRLERDPHTTTHGLAAPVRTSPQTVIVHLYEGFGMKCFHLRWVPHTLIDLQKSNRVHYAQEMIWVLDNHSRTGFKYPLTGDESWMTHVLCHDTVDEFQEAITGTIEGIPKTKQIQIFRYGDGD
jgi:hypothetical protein